MKICKNELLLNVEITGRAVNRGDLEDMKAPCIIKFVGDEKILSQINT